MARDVDGDGGPTPADAVIATVPNGRQLTPGEHVTISTLAGKGLSITEICDVVDRSPHLVKRALVQSKEMLGLLAPEAVASWRNAMVVAGRRGFHQPAKDLLESVKVIERPSLAANANVVQVQTNIVLPGLPQPTTINITPEGGDR